MHELFLISSKLPSSKYLIASLNILKGGKKVHLTKVASEFPFSSWGLDSKLIVDKNACTFANTVTEFYENKHRAQRMCTK